MVRLRKSRRNRGKSLRGGGRNSLRHGSPKDQNRSAATTVHEYAFHHPSGRIQPDVSDGYMARSQNDSPMKDRWSPEQELRSRQYSTSIAKYKGEGRGRSPPRRAESGLAGRSRIEDDIDSYRPSKRRNISRESYISRSRRSSPSPKRQSRPTFPVRGRLEKTRPHRSRNFSSSRSPKRRRTRSPSSTRKDRFRTEARGRSRDWSRSPARGDSWDRRPAIDRAFSPRRPSPARHSRALSRGIEPEIDSYVPGRSRRSQTPPLYRRDRKSSPPRRRSRTPPPRHKSKALSPKPRDISPYSARATKSKHTAESYHIRNRSTSRDPSVFDDRISEPMDAQNINRGHHGTRGNITHGRSRPFQEGRQQFQGSPPHSTPNSSYHGSHHGSPQPNASHPGNRGGWGGQGFTSQGSNSSPPYRQNSYSGGPQSQHQQNQQQFGSQPSYQQSPYRGRGGHHPPRGDRNFSGPQEHRGGYRGRGGHFGNLQWNAKRGGSQNANFATGANSIQTSPALSHKTSRESFDQHVDDEGNHRAVSNPQTEDQRSQGAYQKSQVHSQAKDSRISFAIKSRAPPATPAKAPPDLTAKVKATPRQAGPLDATGPPTQPKSKAFDKREGRHFDRPERSDRKYDSRNEKKHSLSRPTHQRPRSRSPPPKKMKQEPKPRPVLSPEMAASESIYYRKPGNESVVGAGTYGKVFKAIHIYTKDKVALKKIRMEGERDGFPITAVREIKLLQHLRHKHVVTLQEVMVEKNECFMVFEYLSHDLTGLINHPTFQLTSAHKKNLARQMFDGLSYLHRRGVLHRDIKAANILVSNTGQLKYADFGLARFYNKSRTLDYTNRVITIWYRPPELLLGETQYGPAVDVWSAACVFVEMFTKKAVFPGEGGELSQLDKVYNILGTPTRNEWPGIVDLPWFELMQPADRRKRQFETLFRDVLSPAALELVKSMFRYDPIKRPSAEDVLQHSYFLEEEPSPSQAHELEEVEGDWHEFESKAHRRENDRKEKERKKEEYMREREKRKAKEAGLDSSEGIGAKKPRAGDDKQQPLHHYGGDDAADASSKANDSHKASACGSDAESEDEGSARMSMS